MLGNGPGAVKEDVLTRPCVESSCLENAEEGSNSASAGRMGVFALWTTVSASTADFNFNIPLRFVVYAGEGAVKQRIKLPSAFSSP